MPTRPVAPGFRPAQPVDFPDRRLPLHSYSHDCQCAACEYLNHILPDFRPPETGYDALAVLLPKSTAAATKARIAAVKSRIPAAQRRLL